MNESIASDYENPRQKTKYACWIARSWHANAVGLSHPALERTASLF